jgi:peptidoglycan/xylan/chitin deacetylase (PgdA/CDA1 family)
VLVGLAGTAVAYPAVIPDRDAPAGRAHALYGVRTTEKVVALTFDDGPDPRFTPRVLDMLARAHAHATFFVVGRNVDNDQALVRAELAGGNEVENHTYSHGHIEGMRADQVAGELARGAAAIRAAGAPDPTMFRPPRGLTDDIIGVLADSFGYRTVLWDLCVERYVNHTGTRRAVDELMARVHPGAIILAHDGVLDRSRTLAALPSLLQRLHDEGYRVVTVSQLMHLAEAANVQR